MRGHLLTSCILLFLIFGFSFASAGDILINKTYGGSLADQAYSARQTSDGGYILSGYTGSFGAGSNDFYLVKTNSIGDMEWNKTYGGAGGEGVYSVQQTSDNGYILSGYTTSFGAGSYDFYLVKTDSSGTMQWNKTFGGTGYESAQSVQQTSDNGYILAGYTTSFGAGSYDFYLVKTDSSGIMQWNKTFGGASYDEARSVQQTFDGGYILAGLTGSFGAGSYDFWMIKTNSTGGMEWNKTYGAAGDDRANSIQQTSDGGYILSGYTASFGAGLDDFWLVKTNSTGGMQWNKTYGGTSNDQANSVQQTSDGGYILSGYTGSFGAGQQDFWLVKTNSTGGMQWNRTYGGTNLEEAKSVQQTSDNSYILTGPTVSFGAGDWDFWFLKVDSGIPAISINSPPSGANLSSSPATLNWTPSNFASNPTCNVSRNGAVIFSGTCINGAACATTNTTPNGFYLWNVTCYSGSDSATSETRNFSVVIPPFSATGGTITNFTNATGIYTIHTFTSNGTFTVTDSGNVEYLVVAGGGGGGFGGGAEPAGGGGAGGFLAGTVAVAAQTYNVVVGGGGATGANGNVNGVNGANSTAFGITAIGGGGGVSGGGPPAAATGGSGGGGNGYSVNSGGAGIVGQGKNGGNGVGGPNYAGGGGGGAGAVGANGNAQTGGAGGIGIQSSISNTTTYYSGGGGGGSWSGGVQGAGGLGGGGIGGKFNTNAATAGATNTGGGGGGGVYNNAGGSGGSGIVIVRYLTAIPLGVSINSPANGANLSNSSTILNWTPNGFSSNPTCNVSRNGAVIFSGTCTSGAPCATTNATANGNYSWNVTCYAGSDSAISETRNFSVAIPPTASLNSPSSGAILSSSSVIFNWTPSNFATNPACNVTRSQPQLAIAFQNASDFISENATNGTSISGGSAKLATSFSGIGSNIANQATITCSAGCTCNAAGLVNGITNECCPFDDSLNANDFFQFAYGSQKTISKLEVYSSNTYPLHGLQFWVDGSMVASTASTISLGSPWVYTLPTPVTGSTFKFVRPTIGYDQIASEVMLYAALLSYPTTQTYYVTTSGVSQFNTASWPGVFLVSINQTTPASTSIKYLVSFDNRNTWKFYNSTNASWQGASGSINASLGAYGMMQSQIQNLTSAQWAASGGFVAGTLDFAADLGTTDSSATPSLSGISVTPSAAVNTVACTNNQPCSITNSIPNGNYSWNVICYAGSESATSETRNLTVNVTGDTAPPSVALISPSSGVSAPSQAQTFSCSAADAGGLSNITLKIWNSSNVLVYSNTSAASGTSNSTSWDYAFASRGNFTWNCLAYDNSSNSAWAPSNATITIQKPAAISILIPANGSGISRGLDDVDDMLGRVQDNMGILARATEESGQGISGINCSLSIDGAFKSNATTNSTGYCAFSYNKASDSLGIHSISINQSNIPSSYYASSPGATAQYSLDNWSMKVNIGNYRSSGTMFYYVDDAAVVLINVTKNGAPANVTGLSVLLTNQLDQPLKLLSLQDFTITGTGQYKSEIIIPQANYIRWKATAMSDFPGQDSNATSSLHTDIEINAAPTVLINFSMMGSDNQPLANSAINLYRVGTMGKYSIFNQTLNSGTQSVQKAIVQNDNKYTLEIATPEGSAILMQGFNLSAGINFATQQANFTDAKPNQTRHVSAVLASNATGFSTSTLTFVKTFEPTSICSCQNWSFSSSSCHDAWVCNSTSAYSYASNSTHFWFNVTHFTGYAIGQSENENLTIWDETDSGMPYGNQMRYIGQNIRFFANYSNSSSEPITGANCQIWFLDSGWNAMEYNSTSFYEYTRVFTSGGSFDWNVSCNKSGQTTIAANDTVIVNSTIAVVLNSPADNAIVKSAVITYNWTPYGFPGDPSCNLTRNGSLVHISSCTNNEPCAYSNTTANGNYIWNVTCNSGATTRTSSTRALTVNTLYHSTTVEGTLNMNITEISSISLPQNTISFGTVEITQTYDSYPSQFFVIKNDGNMVVDIEVNATNPFLSSNCTSLPCTAYQVKVGANETIPYPICSGNPSKETYTNMYGSSSGLLINDFNFVDNDDSANIYIKFRLPNDEPPGSKSSTVTFWAKSAGSYSCG